MKPVSKIFRHKRGQRLIKEGSWLITGNVFSVLASLVLVRVLTERLDPAQFGQLALGLTVAGLVNQVVMGGMIQGIGRFYSIAAEKRDIGGYLAASRRLMYYATLAVLAMGFALLSGLFLLGYSSWTGLAAVVIVFSILSGYNAVLNDVQNAARQRAVVTLHNGLNAWLKIIFAVGLMAWLGRSSAVVALGYTVSAFLITISQLTLLRRITPKEGSSASNRREWMARIWGYSWPFSTWGIFTWMQLSSDRWALQTFVSTSGVGQYAVLMQLGYAPTAMVMGLAMSFLAPILYQRSGEATDYARNANVHSLVWKITRISMIIAVLAFVGAYALHARIFQLLVSPEYRPISYLLPWIALSGGLFAGGQMLSLKLLSEMKSSLLTRVKIITALLGLFFNVLGAKIYGIHGVVGAQVAFSGIYFTWMVILGGMPSGVKEKRP